MKCIYRIIVVYLLIFVFILLMKGLDTFILKEALPGFILSYPVWQLDSFFLAYVTPH